MNTISKTTSEIGKMKNEGGGVRSEDTEKKVRHIEPVF